MQTPQSASDHYRDQQRITTVAVTAAGSLWGATPPGNFDGWFQDNVSTLVALTSTAQARAVDGSENYVKRALSELGVVRDPEASIDSSKLVGVASDGRTLEGLFAGPIITAKAEIAAADVVDETVVRQAWAKGRRSLEERVLTQVADAERSSTLLHLSVRPKVGYTRLVRAGGCSRCLVLAGRFYRWNDGFLRHPRCMCRHIPATETLAPDLFDDPRKAFDAMSVGEQDKRFTRAGADAIRNGANIGQVVNVRRGNSGLQTGAGKITRTKVYGQDTFISSEGTTKRGFAGKLIRDRGQSPSTSPRLMPESIAEIAESREEYLRLLEQNGYAFDVTKPKNRGSLVVEKVVIKPWPTVIDLDRQVIQTPKPRELTPIEKKRATAERRLSKSVAALDKATDKTGLDAMPLQAKVIVDRAELLKVDNGKPTSIDEIEKLARKVLDVEKKLANPDYDLYYLSIDIGPKWREMHRDEWRRNLQDALHNAGAITVAPTKEWPLPGLKRKGALALYRTNSTPGSAGRTLTEMARDVTSTNPNYFSDASFRINCQRVVQAYELRTRGYDVTANRNPGPGVGPKFTDERIFGAWNSDGQKVESGFGFATAKSVSEMDAIAKAWGPGARGWITVDWKLFPGQSNSERSAHIFNVEVGANGEVRYYDPQPGQINAASHLANIDFKYSRRGARMYRVDNVTPIPETRTLVTPEPQFIRPTEEVPR